MVKLQFMITNYTVKHGKEQISLLRKEYYLLQYLYENANQAFSREQLLNAVWPMEAPSDRTVDDHIYRLRKKLKPWAGRLAIETIKGFGYQLTCEKSSDKAAPVIKDKEFQQLLESLIKKYHLYGQGEAINTFIHKKTLGFELPPDYETIFAYMKGDFWWFVHENQYPMKSKLFFLIHIFQTFSKDYNQAIKYIKNGLSRERFLEHNKYEAETIGLLLAYVFNEEFVHAHQHIDHFIKKRTPEMTEPDHGFYPFFQNIKLLLAIGEQQHDVFKEVSTQMETFYLERPYQREMGIFTIIKGGFLIRNNKVKEGTSVLEAGFEIIRKTNFKSHLFLAFDVSLFLLQSHFAHTVIFTRLEEQREKLEQEYHSLELLSKVKVILEKYLG